MDEVDSAERVDDFCVVGMAAKCAGNAGFSAVQGLVRGDVPRLSRDAAGADQRPAAARLPPCWCGGADRLTIPYLPVLDPALETFYSP
jgi:hypothetical protein